MPRTQKRAVVKKPVKPKKLGYDKLFKSKARSFNVGGNIQPKRDLTRFVRWPRYIRLQRQKQILMKRMKVPPAINQFNKTVSKPDALQLFSLLEKYRPETKVEKKERLLALAKLGEEAKPSTDKPKVVKYGLKHVTALIESKKAKLVIIAHDVEPLEIVLWLPTLCVKMGVPFMIVKGKARLGKVVHKKTSAVLAITEVAPKDKQALNLLCQKALDNYNGTYATSMKTFGGQINGSKFNQREAKEARLLKAKQH
jgi:large subunit ribosomal protein L7Ae